MVNFTWKQSQCPWISFTGPTELKNSSPFDRPGVARSEMAWNGLKWHEYAMVCAVSALVFSFLTCCFGIWGPIEVTNLTYSQYKSLTKSSYLQYLRCQTLQSALKWNRKGSESPLGKYYKFSIIRLS